MQRVFVFLMAGAMLSACAVFPKPLSSRENPLTQGNVQLVLQTGKTTKADVLEAFGAPNITTRDGQGREIWTYQRAAEVAQSNAQSDYWTILLAGRSRSGAGVESSSRMMTLIIKFDRQDKVADFRSRSSNF